MLSLLKSQHGAALQSCRRLPCLLSWRIRACDNLPCCQHFGGPMCACKDRFGVTYLASPRSTLNAHWDGLAFTPEADQKPVSRI